MKPLFLLPLSALLFFASCKKASHRSNVSDNTIKITVIAGNNQTDTIGRLLSDSIKVSVTRGSLPVSNAGLEIVQPGCAYSVTSYAETGPDGTASFPWQLNATIGSQELAISVIDSLKNVLDSTKAMATGVFADHAWLPANCVPQYSNAFPGFAQLPNGRVLYVPNDNVYYSDDNGATWSVLTSFPGLNGGLNSIAAYNNYIFVWNGSALLYSADAGATWQSLPSVANFGYLTTVNITRSGIIFVSAISGVYMSSDMGQSWANISTQPTGWLGYASYYLTFCESADGTLFTVNNAGELWESEDSGISWAQLPGIIDAYAVYADSSGTVYMSNSVGMYGILYRLQKTGNSINWVTLCSFPQVPGFEAAITGMTEANNTFYFLLEGYGLIKTTDFVSFQNLLPNVVGAFCITRTGAGIARGAPVFYSLITYNLHP